MGSNANRGKTITVYLADGDPQGTRIAFIGGWTGLGIASSRASLAGMLARAEANRAGIYVLAGSDPDDAATELVYIGQADNAAKRIAQHEKSKEFWSRAVIFTSSDENLTRGHLEYLESRLIAMAQASNKASVDNKTVPARGLPEHEQVVMEHFLDETQVLLPVLGFSFLRPDVEEPDSPQAARFVMQDSGCVAHAIESGEDFVVLAGSTARKATTTSFVGFGPKKRDKLVETGALADGSDSGYFVFVKDVPFNSPSGAATVVAGAARNGRTTWKHENSGVTYAQWVESQVNAALT